LLEDHPQVAALGEIFHDSYLNDANFYYHYYLHRIREHPDVALPTEENIAAIFTGYIQHLSESYRIAEKADEWLLLSVNYNSLHNLNTFWQDFYKPPHILKVVRDSRYHTIHMVRRSVLRTAISERRAKLTGVWHLMEGQSRPLEATKRVTVEPQSLLAELRARRLEIALVEAAFDGYPLCLTIEYEKFFDDDGHPVPEVVRRVADFLDLSQPIKLETRFRRTRGASLRESVENYDALAEVLRATEFASELDP
jgi:hypothetical protein